MKQRVHEPLAETLRGPGGILLVSCYELGHQPLGLASPLAFLERAGFSPEALDIAVERFDREKTMKGASMGAEHITKDLTMQEILAVFPGAQRALFSRYHVGGCSSCGFQPTETLEQVGASHNIPDVEEAIRYLEQSRERERDIQIRPEELASALKAGQKLQLLDVRTPEEHKIARIDGAQLVTETLARDVVERWPKDSPIVVHCHLGERSVEAAFFLINQGFTNVRSLAGGIDAWSAQVDPTVPRYAAAPAHSK